MSAIEVRVPDVNEAAAIPPSFVPSNLNDEAHGGEKTAHSASDDGIYFDTLADGAVLELETKHHRYTLVKKAGTQALISGHPVYCPEPVLVEIAGSTGRGSMLPMLKVGFIGCRRHLVFKGPTHRTAVITSRILNLRQIG